MPLTADVFNLAVKTIFAALRFAKVDNLLKNLQNISLLFLSFVTYVFYKRLNIQISLLLKVFISITLAIIFILHV